MNDPGEKSEFCKGLKLTTRVNDTFWAQNKAMSDRRFNEWLLKG